MRGIAHTRIFAAKYEAEYFRDIMKQSWGRDVSCRTREIAGDRYAVTVTWPWSASLG